MEIGFIILMVLAVPIVIIWPLLIWGGAVMGLYQAIRKRARSKVSSTQKTS
jgi:hypothetical protein